MLFDMSVPDWLVFITGLACFMVLLHFGRKLDD